MRLEVSQGIWGRVGGTWRQMGDFWSHPDVLSGVWVAAGGIYVEASRKHLGRRLECIWEISQRRVGGSWVHLRDIWELGWPQAGWEATRTPTA